MKKDFNKLVDLPKQPGVYHFLDENGVVLYVGKAKNLKNRVKQYFLKELGRGPSIGQMVERATGIRWIETESEIEAVILEAELIRKLKPKYNIRSKDDKSFLVIKITKKNQKTNEFPCVELVRYKDLDLKDKTADYFGPYPAGLLLKKSLRYLRKIFPYRDCSQAKFKTYSKKKRACIYGDIALCNAPCIGNLSAKDYQRNIFLLKSFLRGKKQKVIDSLEKLMKEKSKKHQFEEAAVIRNRLQALYHIKNVAIGIRDDLYSSNELIFSRIECYDISNIGDKYAVGSMVVFTNSKMDKDQYRKFKIRGKSISDLERLQQVLERRFNNDWPLPDLVVIDGGKQQLKVAKEVINGLNLNIPIISISKGPKRNRNEFHYSNAAVANYFKNNLTAKNIIMSSRDEAHRFAINYYRKVHNKELFND